MTQPSFFLNRKPDVQGSLGITGYKSGPLCNGPPCCLSQLLSCPVPPPPTMAIMILHSPYTIQCSVPSECRKYCASFCSHWTHQVATEHVTISLSVSSSFPGMELSCPAAGSCERRFLENWNPAYCSSHGYNYFLCLQESIFCDPRKTRRQNSHLF